MKELFEQLKASGICCICGQPLTGVRYFNMINVKVTVPWSYPVWGNHQQRLHNQGMAYSCDECYVIGWSEGATVKNVVEIDESGRLIYHSIDVVDEQYNLSPGE